MKKNKIYFAGPLFSKAERYYNQELCFQIESNDFKVFLPQRDGAELDKPPYIGMTQAERNKVIFDLDVKQVLDCDIFLFVLDGRVPDEGACFELGIAYNQKVHNNSKKRIIGLHTDMRASFINSKLNAMIECSFDKIFMSEKKLIDYLNEI
ncbi:nucleoside 2-deoxyribosyltransferase [uncultured Polaribacter sp.]|uniref:nucleoside 2-deoxyribosyltransferase n=1 Tax=uncultured Polaribacter sp. TaxID=174711 RepID=UPI00262DE0B3|nr:nucleoside 2-deoxyribosyltransferase [uncultured Polaribacter sp.]